MTHKRGLAQRSVFGVLLLSIAACGGGGSSAVVSPTPDQSAQTGPAQSSLPPQELGSVVVGSGAEGGFAPLVYPVAAGVFDAHGVDATLRIFASGAEAQQAMLAGDVDITISSEPFPVLAKTQGGVVHVVAGAATSPDNIALVARESIQSPNDLVGKKVGYLQGTSAEFFMLRYLTKHSVDMDQVELINTTTANMVPLFERGDIDAFFLFRPFPQQALDVVPDAHIVAWNGDDDVYFLTTYFLFSEKLGNNTQLAEACIRVLLETATTIEEDIDKVLPVVADELQTEEEAVRTSLSVLDHKLDLTPAHLAIEQDAAEWLLGAERITSMPDWTNFFSPQFLKAVAPESVTLNGGS
jgi:ABC-type nitrate/sulfonate/bicarbonate transport system substrate-binding protein